MEANFAISMPGDARLKVRAAMIAACRRHICNACSGSVIFAGMRWRAKTMTLVA
jgi:hypothetical protein